VIRKPHADPDHHQKLITSAGLDRYPRLSSLVDVRRLSCLPE